MNSQMKNQSMLYSDYQEAVRGVKKSEEFVDYLIVYTEDEATGLQLFCMDGMKDHDQNELIELAYLQTEEEIARILYSHGLSENEVLNKLSGAELVEP